MAQATVVPGVGSVGLRVMGKRSLEWDLNDWKWDGDLFTASQSNLESQRMVMVPVNGVSSNSSSFCSDEVEMEQGKRELERKRRVVDRDDGVIDDGAGNLNLKVGAEKEVVNMEGGSGKKIKMLFCQVDDCRADLSCAKDYHRRHKVCEIHSKANKALVVNEMQRFCQQCSRFHVLQEFDEGKRSCRRRLAGHNKRRRKTQPEPALIPQPANNDQGSGHVLISLLKVLSNMHANNRSDDTTEQNVVANLLRTLPSQSGSHGMKCIPGLPHESPKSASGDLPVGSSETSSASMPQPLQTRPPDQCHTKLASEISTKASDRLGNGQVASSEKPVVISPNDSAPTRSEVQDSCTGRVKLNNFDLNEIYVDSDDGVDDLERSPAGGNSGTSSVEYPSYTQQDSPPQVSGTSDAASAPSPSSSSQEAESRTDRIVFKLFGKEPNEFPILMRAQILDWLAHSPTEIESYIRPGCIVLTIYLRLSEPIWEELCSDLSSSLARLCDFSSGTFWSTGWVCMKVPRGIAFAYDGLVVADTPIPNGPGIISGVLSVKPIAVSIAEHAEFQITGYNLSRSTTRLLCALEGEYLVHETGKELEDGDDSFRENAKIECRTLSCSIPAVTGRGFIEVEDHGLSSSFYPFIVAEKEVCHELRMLETILDSVNMDQDGGREPGKLEAIHQAQDFIHELGWLLHRSRLKSRLGHQVPNYEVFSFKRFRGIMEYSMDHDWCAVVRKLLDILLQGTVGVGVYSSLKEAMSEMGLLHRATRRNSKPLVQLLLGYMPMRISEQIGYAAFDERHEKYLFRPDVMGPGGLTPLHIAAGRDGAENVIDALTDDPGKIGIETWKNARDSTGSTPEDYARLSGRYAYIHLVQKKIINRSLAESVVLEIQEELTNVGVITKQPCAGLEIERSVQRIVQRNCRRCVERRVTAYGGGHRSLVYKPAMLSMIAVATVCVCVALLFKSMPEIACVFEPFRWELTEYGSS
ncbi:hypothetical protein Droror1_Dr00003783 [Drosera rotundifolia]